MQNSSADTLPSLSSSSPTTSTSTPPLPTTWPAPTPRRTRLLSSSEPSTLQRRDAAARAAKTLLRDTIREDWTWPSPLSTPHPTTPLQWCERSANSSSPSPEPTDSTEAADPYKYDNPDSVASVMQTRKRKRRRAVVEEMRWNTGLATYMARRDAWTGGVLRSSPPPPTSRTSTSTSTSTISPPQPHTHTHTHTPASPTSPAANVDLLEFVPLHAPLLPANNPIRASITPATYPSIYTKVITQGLTPTIPINLADVTRAMVQGWKEDGEWPPQSAAVEAPVAGKRGGKRRGLMEGLKGVGRVKRVLGLGRDGGEGEGG